MSSRKKLLQGIDTFDFSSLKGRRVAVIANYTSIDKDGVSLVEKMTASGLNVTAVFSPEHGFFPVAQDMECVGTENKINDIPVFSLYGNSVETLAPKDEYFDLFDTVVYDIQDIGSRYYTYLATLAIFMDKLQKIQRELVVLDRMNPIGGSFEGSLLDDENYKSFVGYIPLFHRHGLTSGEIAAYYRKLKKYDFPFKIAKLQGWERDSFADDYDYPWLPTSPNMPTVDTAVLYPGGCLLEGTELSEGRGTTMPFLLAGSHGLDPFKLKKELDKENIPGITFIPMEFRPMFQKLSMKRCGGVYIALTDRKKARPLRAYISIIRVFRKMLGDDGFFRAKPYEFIDKIPAIDLLLGDKALIEMFRNSAESREIDSYLQKCEESFEEQFSGSRFYN